MIDGGLVSGTEGVSMGASGFPAVQGTAAGPIHVR